jgi:hypothetical protein
LLLQVNIDNPSFGKNSLERDQSVGEIMNEIAIIREQMKHPNVVRFHKTFVESKLSMRYITSVPCIVNKYQINVIWLLATEMCKKYLSL